MLGHESLGLLAALAACQRGKDVHVLDRIQTGPKPESLERGLGAEPDDIKVVIQFSEP